MTPREQLPISRCRIRACPCLGHFGPYDDLCPLHRDGLHDARPPVPTEIEEVTDAATD